MIDVFQCVPTDFKMTFSSDLGFSILVSTKLNSTIDVFEHTMDEF